MEFADRFVVLAVSSFSGAFCTRSLARSDNDFHDLFTPDEHTQERADSNRQQQRRPGVACASIGSPIGEAYLGAMRAAINGKRMRVRSS